jgi:hypothetical protein
MLHVTNTDSFNNMFKWLIPLRAQALSYSPLYVCAVIFKSNKQMKQQTGNETKAVNIYIYNQDKKFLVLLC